MRHDPATPVPARIEQVVELTADWFDDTLF
jgi:hypothetical protein